MKQMCLNRQLSNCNDGNLMLLGQWFASFLFQKQGFPRLERQHGNSGGGAGLQRLRAEAGDVKPQIVPLLGHFDGDSAAGGPGQPPAAGEAFSAIVGLFYEIRYGGRACSRAERMAADAMVDRLRSALGRGYTS